MSTAGVAEDAGSSRDAPSSKGSGKLVAASASGPGWTKVSCPCCMSDRVDPLVLVKLGERVRPETKRWLLKLMGTPQKEGAPWRQAVDASSSSDRSDLWRGEPPHRMNAFDNKNTMTIGAGLLAHPGEDASGDIMVLSAPRCTLLRATEELGLCKTYKNGEMEAFSYNDRYNFKDSDNMEVFLTLAERQFIVKYELDGMRAQREIRVPGLDNYTLQPRNNIWLKLTLAGVIVDTVALHNQEQLKALSQAWYAGNQLAQPLDSVNSYFGSSLAFYFSFLDFYTWSLLPPAVLGLFITYFSGEVQKEMVESVSGSGVIIDDHSGSGVSGHMIQALLSMLWSTVVMELWKRRSASLSYRWGTLHLAERFAEPRPGFHGNLGVNAVTGRLEPLFPEWQRDLRMALVSVPVVGLFLGLVVFGMLVFYWGEAQVKTIHGDWDSLLTQPLLYLPSILHIVYTNVLSTVYRTVAHSLTEYENHREESAFDNHLTGKVLVFTFFNYFAVLFHIAFFKQDVPLLRKRLASLLIVTQIINQFTEVVVPFMVDRFISAPKRTETEDDPQEDKFRSQGNLPVFPGLFAEYIELLVQFGYLSLFSCVFPLTAVLLLINNLTEIRSDAYKICKLFRKPFYAPVADMGVWKIAFEVLSFVSVASNCWLLMLSPQIQVHCPEGELSCTNVLLLAVAMEHVLILVKVVLAVLIPDEPGWIQKKRLHIEFKSRQALGLQTAVPGQS